jgi:hypothetical protein
MRIDVENFAKEHQLTEMTPLLTNGAFVAKDPPAVESVEDLTEDEKTAIRNEVLHKWSSQKHPSLRSFFALLVTLSSQCTETLCL